MFKTRQCQAKDNLNIVTTTTTLESIARSVGGDHVSVSAISTGREDPHFIQAKPSYMLKAKNADLWIRVGMDLEIGYERLILEGSRNPRIHTGMPGHLDASMGIVPLEVATQRISRSMGDVHPLGNPHYWLDPYNGRIMARNICRRLKDLDPVHAEDYERNLAAFVLKLDSAMFGGQLVKAAGGERLWMMQSNGTLEDFIREYNEKVSQGKQPPAEAQQRLSLGGWLAKLKPFEHSKIATYHRSWSYFVRRFGLDVVAELEPKPGIPPSPGHLKEVIETSKQNHIKMILMEVFYSEKAARFVAGRTDARVVIVPNAVGGTKQAKDYLTLIDAIVENVAEGLKE
jgi:ABC-type Zn uptake system ZnuABC Zn-binding protein ZnuA